MSAFTLFVGTVGEGLWISADGGDTFHRRANELFIEADVRALAVQCGEVGAIFAGTNCGLYRTVDAAKSWELLPAGFGTGWPGTTAETVWSLAISPHNPNTIFAGLCPSAIYRSRDGGISWTPLDANLAETCGVILYPRVTCIVPDPDPLEPETIWAGVEIDGIYCSRDGGDTWTPMNNGLSSLDIHSISVLCGVGTSKRILAATNNDLNISHDNGATWNPCNTKDRFEWGYCRGIASKADDPQTLYQGNGNGPPGSSGAIQISHDGGDTWTKAALSQPPNSTIWTFATSSSLPNLIVAASVSGYLYLSDDGGSTWSKLEREFGEIRSLALL